jgi:hypothetical protein
VIDLKILSYHSAQRYSIRQTVVSALRVLQNDYPGVQINITELKDWINIEKYTPVLSAPSLVVNGKLVCVGRFPSRREVLGWLKSAIEAQWRVSMP